MGAGAMRYAGTHNAEASYQGKMLSIVKVQEYTPNGQRRIRKLLSSLAR